MTYSSQIQKIFQALPFTELNALHADSYAPATVSVNLPVLPEAMKSTSQPSFFPAPPLQMKTMCLCALAFLSFKSYSALFNITMY